MTSDDRRVTPDELADLTETRTVDRLSLWAEDPYGAGDVGAETVAAARFGATEAVLVHGDIVLWGGVIVEAERISPRDGGTVAVVDVARKGWSLSEAKAEVLRRYRRNENTQTDGDLLAELVIGLWEEDKTLAGLACVAAEIDPARAETVLDRWDDLYPSQPSKLRP